MLTNKQLHELADGSLTFDVFVTQAQDDIAGLAGRIVKRWTHLPSAMDMDDLTQVMLMTVHTNIGKHNPRLGSIRNFIVAQCCYAVRKEIARQMVIQNREATSYDRGDNVQVSDQEDTRLAREMCELLPRDERQRHIMTALVRTCSLDDTVAVLLAQPATFRMFAPRARRPVTKPSSGMRRNTRRSIYLTARKWMQRAQAVA